MIPVGTLPAPRTPVGVLGFLRAWLLGVPAVSKRRKTIALGVALFADLVQLVFWPAFLGGAASPCDDAIDVAVALVLSVMLGFNARLALAFALELVPGLDFFPTWTAVVASIPASEPPQSSALPERL